MVLQLLNSGWHMLLQLPSALRYPGTGARAPRGAQPASLQYRAQLSAQLYTLREQMSWSLLLCTTQAEWSALPASRFWERES